MAARSNTQSMQKVNFTQQELQAIQAVETKPLEEFNYEIIPTHGSGPSSVQQDFLFKLIVIGDSGIGKSCLMHRMCHNEF